MINIKKIFTYLLNLEFYTSPLDRFLAKFRRAHPDLSASQRKEQKKYAHIFNQRDKTVIEDNESEKIWNQF